MRQNPARGHVGNFCDESGTSRTHRSMYSALVHRLPILGFPVPHTWLSPNRGVTRIPTKNRLMDWLALQFGGSPGAIRREDVPRFCTWAIGG